MRLTNRLHRILYERGLTGTEFAEICGVDESQLNRIKNGRATPTVITALRIAQAIGLEVEDVFDPPPSCRTAPLSGCRPAGGRVSPSPSRSRRGVAP